MLGWFLEYAGLQDNIVNGEIKTVKSLLKYAACFQTFLSIIIVVVVVVVIIIIIIILIWFLRVLESIYRLTMGCHRGSPLAFHTPDTYLQFICFVKAIVLYFVSISG